VILPRMGPRRLPGLCFFSFFFLELWYSSGGGHGNETLPSGGHSGRGICSTAESPGTADEFGNLAGRQRPGCGRGTGHPDISIHSRKELAGTVRGAFRGIHPEASDRLP